MESGNEGLKPPQKSSISPFIGGESDETQVAQRLFALFLLISVTASAQTGGKRDLPPLQIKEQGSFAVGGTVITNPGKFDPYRPTPDGQTFHGDHAYVFYQLPAKARQLPLVMWHGIGQFSKTWETTPDGREGYQNIFLRRDFGVYLIDQPRRGNAGRSTQPISLTPTPDEQGWFGTFRLGIWPDFFPGVQFSRDPEALNQYFRQMTPTTGPLDGDVMTRAVAALFDKVGPGILVTHSHSGGFGWRTAIKNQNVRAIVSYEPGSGFVFPEGEVPAPIPEFRWTAGGGGNPTGGIHVAHQDSDRHLLRRFHSQRTNSKSGARWMARSSGDGAEMARCGEQAWWRCHGCPFARSRH